MKGPLRLGRPERPEWVRLVLLSFGVLLAGLAGYSGYVLYPRFDLPSATGTGLLLLAAAAGVASFFSPCSFPLLLALLSKEAGGTRRIGRMLLFAAAFSVGAVAFILLLAAIFGMGGRALVGSVTFTSTTGIAIRIIVGALLVVLGLVQAEVLRSSFHGVDRLTRPLIERQAALRRKNPFAGFAVFGFSYLLIAFG